MSVEQEYVERYPVADLVEHPENPRRGNDVAVTESIEHNGFYGTVIVQRSTGHVLAGNTRLRAMRDAGSDSIPAMVVDVDDETATRILLADNRLSDLAEYDNRQLLRLLDDVSDYEPDLFGTGYDETALALLRAAVELDQPTPPPPPADDEFPSIDPDDLKTSFRCPSCSYEWSGSPRPGDDLSEAS